MGIYDVCVCWHSVLTARHTGWMQNLHLAELSCMEVYKMHTCTSLKCPPSVSVHHRCYASHHLHLVLQLSIPFPITLLPPLHKCSKTATHSMPMSTSKLPIFFKARCSIYWVFVFPTYLTHVNYLLFIRLLSFFLNISLTSFCHVALASIFPMSSVIFFRPILQSAVIFRNTYVVL